MDSSNYDRLFLESEEDLKRSPLQLTFSPAEKIASETGEEVDIVQERLDRFKETSKGLSKKDKSILLKNSEAMNPGLQKKIKKHVERLRSFGFSEEYIRKNTKEKFVITVYWFLLHINFGNKKSYEI